MESPAAKAALGEGGFHAGALHIIQPDGVGPLPKMSMAWGRDSCPAAQLPADHLGIPQIPAVVTDGPPTLFMKHLHSASTAVRAVGQADLCLCDVGICQEKAGWERRTGQPSPHQKSHPQTRSQSANAESFWSTPARDETIPTLPKERGCRDGLQLQVHTLKWWCLLHASVWTRQWRPGWGFGVGWSP